MRLLLVTTVLLINAVQFRQTYGFDGSASCNPKVGRRGRAQLIATIPCDLSVQSYCNLPGNLYPWHAVRRFVHENQGLMKRMYGDVKHISVLRTEINNNDIDVDDVEIAAARYSRSGWKKNKYLYTDYQNTKNNDVLTEPYFRPTSTSTTSKPLQTTTQSMPSSGPKTNLDESTTTRQPASVMADRTSTEPIASDITSNIYENITVTPMEANIKIVSAPNLSGGSGKNRSETATLSTTLRIFLPAKLHTQASITPPPQDDNEDSTADVSSTMETFIITIKADAEQQADDDQAASESNTYQDREESAVVVEDIVAGTNDTDAKMAGPNFRPASVTPSTEHMEGQLFQDVVQKEAPAPPIFNARGVNACPVKEEVVAPFWANNTRGEVLALLNLYPFEQYVHWEKCTNELKQMYCRDGCRCEQQFRLHRLLAYDPHNECRGIFSDWFRFPSCCICKCYDIPLEYRVTSRSPRSIDKHMVVDEAESGVKRAVYEHAAEDWYRPGRDDDIEMNDFE